ncbi:leukocyte-associated immunoglobulin-like receptor 2 [Sturnira hondurensis]|uniref:leukocyte-associated immunoglobulin-like receptor 2 n=1 Tax=Sturnira hondurensis TaxID=192404 RepID=UPI001879BF7B|nr:leukocyte-associated immunoglobulin-like receptor 2 [Sturnira hondurensis]
MRKSLPDDPSSAWEATCLVLRPSSPSLVCGPENQANKNREDSERLVRVPNPTTLLDFGLCLGQAVHTQEGSLPKPCIWVEPGPVVRRGQPVTIVCRGPAGADTFRLQQAGRSFFRDQRNVSPCEGAAGLSTVRSWN